MKAERETADRLIAAFPRRQDGASFRGRISGVTRAGLFVKLEDTGADGLIRSARWVRNNFNYDEKRHARSLTQRCHAPIGDVVTSVLVEAAPVAGALRFERLSEGTGRRAASVTE